MKFYNLFKINKIQNSSKSNVQENLNRRLQYRLKYHDIKRKLLNSLPKNPKLKIAVIVAFILITKIAVLLVILLLPIVLRLIRHISENGLQGLVNVI